jgi:Na+-driven multidrug efflux pump
MKRARIEYALAIAFIGLAILTAINPQWIETVFGVEPDAGSGALEWLIVALFGVLAVVAGLLGRRDHRAAQRAQLEMGG